MRNPGEDPQEEAPALVLERWNSWVKVYLPQTEETRWVNLDEVDHRPLSVKASAEAEEL
ncbi:MAG: hypothetical protein QF724_07220 [Planctomycetota bacterium]|nr:hypothetical protein [Planctomycetota bacterium]MDP6956422.1 hypothetical protein [Planctomycetota bacterium]